MSQLKLFFIRNLKYNDNFKLLVLLNFNFWVVIILNKKILSLKIVISLKIWYTEIIKIKKYRRRKL